MSCLRPFFLIFFYCVFICVSVSQRESKQPSEICKACGALSVGSLNISTCYTATCPEQKVWAAARLLPCDKPWACGSWYLGCLCEIKIWHRWSGSRIVLPGVSRWSNLGLYTLFRATVWVTLQRNTADWNMDPWCGQPLLSVWYVVWYEFFFSFF